MNLKSITSKIKSLDGNYIMKGSVYISNSNVKNLIILFEVNPLESMLITPYLINEVSSKIYELHDYELSVEIIRTGKLTFVEYDENNILTNEVLDNFNPKIILKESDRTILIKYLTYYFNTLNELNFEEDRKSNENLESANLYYQIF